MQLNRIYFPLIQCHLQIVPVNALWELYFFIHYQMLSATSTPWVHDDCFQSNRLLSNGMFITILIFRWNTIVLCNMIHSFIIWAGSILHIFRYIYHFQQHRFHYGQWPDWEILKWQYLIHNFSMVFSSALLWWCSVHAKVKESKSNGLCSASAKFFFPIL